MLSTLKAKGLLWPAVMTLAGLAILVSLGNWQMRPPRLEGRAHRRHRRAQGRRARFRVRGRMARLRRRRHRVHARQGRAAGCSTTRSCISTPSMRSSAPAITSSRRCSRPTAAWCWSTAATSPRTSRIPRRARPGSLPATSRSRGSRACPEQKALSTRTTTQQKTSGTGATSPAWPRRHWDPARRAPSRSSSTPRPRRTAGRLAEGRRHAARAAEPAPGIRAHLVRPRRRPSRRLRRVRDHPLAAARWRLKSAAGVEVNGHNLCARRPRPRRLLVPPRAGH